MNEVKELGPTSVPQHIENGKGEKVGSKGTYPRSLHASPLSSGVTLLNIILQTVTNRSAFHTR